MATYPIKMLKDETGNPFVPLVSTTSIQDPGGLSLDQKLATKLEVANIIAGTDITLSTSGNNITISASVPAGNTLIDNLTTSTAGQGALDAHQGKVLKDSIPIIVDDVTDTSATKALSANQGYVLNQKFGDYALISSLAPVALSGNYSDLSGTPTKPVWWDGISGQANTNYNLEFLNRNYNFFKWTGDLKLNTTTSPITKELTITTKGRPVYIAVSGDNNPTLLSANSTCWFDIYFYRNNTEISHQIVESHALSHNIPFAMIFLDVVPAGTYTYKVSFKIGEGESDLNEDGDSQSPNFIIFEI